MYTPLTQPRFRQRLLAASHHGQLVDECTALVEHRINQQPTVRKLMFRAGIAVLNAIKADAIRHIVNDMLPRFADSLDPLHQRFEASGALDFSEFLICHRSDAVEALLGVTDRRVQSYGNSAVVAVYASLRPSAEHEVDLALPELSRILNRFLIQAEVS